MSDGYSLLNAESGQNIGSVSASNVCSNGNRRSGSQDSLHDSEVMMKVKESSSVCPTSLEANKQNENEVAAVKPIVIIAQTMMIYAFGALSYLALVVGPKKSGFFCGDESIRYPYRNSTIPIPFLYLGCYVTLIPTILIIETLCEKYRYTKYQSRLPIKFECNGFIIPGVIVRFVRFFLISQLGFMIELFILNITKYSVGRLRPHFLAVCKPSINTSTIAACGDAATYIQHYICLGKDQGLIKDGRLSFFSGHTSHSFYYAMFLIIYMHCRFGRTMRTSVFFPIIYALLISISAFVGYTRINDNKHHVSDVIAGAIVGIVIALCMLILFRHQFCDIIFDKKRESAPEIQVVEAKDSTDTVSEAPSATTTVHTQTTSLSVPVAVNSKIISKDSGAEEFVNISSSEEEQEKPTPPAPVKKSGQKRNSQSGQSVKPIVVRPKILNAESNV